MSDSNSKARYYWAVLYPENMRDSWQDDIDLLLQVPYAYCIHDKDYLSDIFLPDNLKLPGIATLPGAYKALKTSRA